VTPDPFSTDSAASASVSPASMPTSTEAHLPEGWSTSDVGPGALPGSASYHAGSFFVRGAGSDIWGRSDGFRFVFHRLEGDGEIVGRVVGLSRANLLAKAGVMIRETLAVDSRHAGLFVTPTAGLRFLRRREMGGATTSALKARISIVRAPCWLKISRSGATVTGHHSVDGNDWRMIASDIVEMSNCVYVGLAVTSQPGGSASRCTFENVTIYAADGSPLF
jgi:hypothetical protein